ncbi:hypothetical protein [Trichlorobacter lovleyi]|uniref:Kid repeat protein n=1 Tax=Trichlorobacter lovleyi (strain ATCC BAA-1151 / DSM 17278 / SZ) TaxID=398767 RepID=B3EAS9_TRIL1|nr:hypothetical protein [Trichlorobacter lovleyi]ACD96962.1 kid repeat protein [Trichlorobacter lovleyi SZ]
MHDEVTKSQLLAVIETMNDKFQQVLECFSVHSKEIYELKTELKEDIALVDAKVMGLSKRMDAVEKHLSAEITEVRDELRAHRETVELHAVPKKRVLKKVA